MFATARSLGSFGVVFWMREKMLILLIRLAPTVYRDQK